MARPLSSFFRVPGHRTCRDKGRALDRKLHLAGFTAVLLAGSAGCAGRQPPPAPKPCPVPVRIELIATDRINPVHGEALPTRVRLYQLRKLIRLEESDFAEIWEKPAEALDADVVDVQERTLFPSQREVAEVELTPDTRFVVGMAVFRRPTGTQWRSIIPLPDSARLCAAYKGKPPPNPALTFRFDMYRAEGRSFLLGADPGHDLPQDVAPARKPAADSAKPRERKERRTMPTEVPSTPTAPSAPDAPSTPQAPPAAQAPSKPTAPSAASSPW